MAEGAVLVATAQATAFAKQLKDAYKRGGQDRRRGESNQPFRDRDCQYAWACGWERADAELKKGNS